MDRMEKCDMPIASCTLQRSPCRPLRREECRFCGPFFPPDFRHSTSSPCIATGGRFAGFVKREWETNPRYVVELVDTNFVGRGGRKEREPSKNPRSSGIVPVTFTGVNP